MSGTHICARTKSNRGRIVDHGDGTVTVPKGLLTYLNLVHGLVVVGLFIAGMAAILY